MDERSFLEVRDLRVQFRGRDGIVDAVDGLDLRIDHGEIVGLVGESGSGKSMTALSITRLLPPGAELVSGEIRLDGVDLVQLSEREMSRVRGARLGMLFQQPKASLDPTSTIGEQVGEAFSIHQGGGKAARQRHSLGLLSDVGIPEAERRAKGYAHQLSGGMAQRVMIAAALSGEPELLIADEPTTALDVTIQAQILRLLVGLCRQKGMAMLLITHDLGVVATIADRVAVMYAGRIVEEGATEQILHAPQHPYTEALLKSSMLSPDEHGRLYAIPGSAPRPGQVMVGCRFRARCEYADRLGIAQQCESHEPGLAACEAEHHARCWAVEEGLIHVGTGAGGGGK